MGKKSGVKTKNNILKLTTPLLSVPILESLDYLTHTRYHGIELEREIYTLAVRWD